MNPRRTPRLQPEALRPAHAGEMFPLLGDPALYEFLDYGPPQSVQALEDLYRRLAVGHSPDGAELWLNWLVRRIDGEAIGYVQATVYPGRQAYVAYVFASRHWGQGYAFEAMTNLLAYLNDVHPVPLFLAVAEARNIRSTGLLERLGFRPAEAAEHGVELTDSERLFCRPGTVDHAR